MANLAEEVTTQLDTLVDALENSPAVTEVLAGLDLAAGLVPGVGSVQNDVASLIGDLREGIAGLPELDLKTIVEAAGVPAGDVDAVVDLMATTSSLSQLAAILAAQMSSDVADRIKASLDKVGAITDLIDTVENWSDQVRDEIVQDLQRVEDLISP